MIIIFIWYAVQIWHNIWTRLQILGKKITESAQHNGRQDPTWYTYRNVGEIKDIYVYDFQILFIVPQKNNTNGP